MDLLPLGATGLPVTRLGLGLAALGRPGYINLGHGDDLDGRRRVAALEAHTHAVLDAAYALGVRYFDMARSYGRAEAFFAAWLAARDLPPDALTVGSKWGYTYTAEWQVDADVHEVKEHSLAVLRRQWRESRAHLGAHLDLYQIHSATLDTGVLENAAVLAELARLKDAGVAIGLSLSGTGQAATLRRALGVEVDGAPLFQTVQATWNVLEPSAGAALAEAHAAGWGVIVKEALANGRLTARGAGQPHYDALAAQARRLDTTPDALALAAVLAEPWATVALSGAATEAHLASNRAALSVTLDGEARAALRALAEPPDAYWQRRSDLDWQ